MTAPTGGISIQVDVAGTIGFTNSLSKQVPFAMSIALNRTYDEAQLEIRKEIERKFVLRERGYILRTIRRDRDDMATKDRLQARVRLQSPSRKFHPNASLLAPFVDGGEKRADSPARPIAIPTDVIRPSFRQQVPRFLYPKSLGLLNANYTVPPVGKRKKRRSKSWKAVRPFVLDPKQHRGLAPNAWGVYMRTGPDREDIEMIWSYKMRVPLPKRLPFEPIVQATVDKRWAVNMRGAFDFALRTAK